MVRLSLVNLYLHGFADPHVVEYDTLTQDDKWNELADVILANPPFMSPKGGIKPHKRFSVQATRSEVLFVDYMAEHLTATGRAAIVVPEGIIFQSGTAYKALRKMLVESCLVAVVSLPAGVFNPYSGVKTSILILDKRMHKQTDSVLFVKVQNDGFNLGAQRRAVAGNDLPEATRLLRSWMTAPQTFEDDGAMAQAVARSLITENEDFNLSGERYAASVVQNTEHELVRLGDVCEVNPRKSEVDALPGQTSVSFVPMKDLAENSSHFVPQEERRLDDVRQAAYTYFRDGDVLVAKVTPCFENGKAGIARNLLSGIGFGSSEYYVLRPSVRLLPELLYYFMTSQHFKSIAVPAMTGTGGLQRVPKALVEEFKFPLPPLEVQQQVVAEIEGYQQVIFGARAVLENYRPRISIDLKWPKVAIKEVAAVESGYGFPLDYQGRSDEEIPFLKVSDMNLPGNERHIVTWNHSVSRATLSELKGKAYPAGTVVFPKIGAAIATNKKRILSKDSTYDNNVMGIIPDASRLLSAFLHTYLLGFDLSGWASESQPPSMRKTTVETYEIPLPPLETQRAIVAEIEAEQALVSANRELIRRMEAKIKAAIDRLWGSGE